MTGQRTTGGGNGLGLRAASAAVLVPVALGTAYLGGPIFVAAMGAAGVLAWLELRRLLRRRAVDAASVAGIAGLAAACALFTTVGAVAAAAAAAAAALVVAGAERGGLRERAAGLAGTGIILLLVVATLTLRGDDPAGRATVFWLLAVVWASDTGAYLAGRTLGGPRLAPRISPAKTWAGAVGGVAAAAGASILLGWSMPLAGWVAERPPLALLAAAGVLGSITGQIGDLAESALKRRVGADDSGRLIPGHGGILDRGDSFAAAAFALILATVIGGGEPPWSYSP
ncbi:MAG: phosphatidate cytidylyltransferase [Rhodospirillaceae bacterium]|nr:phosphatidate cytidylyltransferase [Rhodospirillaceae bacterium]